MLGILAAAGVVVVLSTGAAPAVFPGPGGTGFAATGTWTTGDFRAGSERTDAVAGIAVRTCGDCRITGIAARANASAVIQIKSKSVCLEVWDSMLACHADSRV